MVEQFVFHLLLVCVFMLNITLLSGLILWCCLLVAVVPCHRHRTWQPTLSQNRHGANLSLYYPTMWNVTQQPILMSWIWSDREILLQPPTHAVNTQLYDAVVHLHWQGFSFTTNEKTKPWIGKMAAVVTGELSRKSTIPSEVWGHRHKTWEYSQGFCQNIFF